MSDDTMRIAATLAAGWYDHIWDGFDAEWLISGKTYRLAEEDQYKELGENPDAADSPVILFCETDGKFYEVDFDAYVHETSAESRKAQAERLRKMGSGIKQAGPEPGVTGQ